MPYRSKVPCKHGRCPRLVEHGETYCEEHKKLHPKFNKTKRSSTKLGYGSQWQKARVIYLHSHPLCVRCMERGLYTQATVVDHVIPHKGNQELFWNTDNWQSLCKRCHDHKTLTEDVKRS